MGSLEEGLRLSTHFFIIVENAMKLCCGWLVYLYKSLAENAEKYWLVYLYKSLAEKKYRRQFLLFCREVNGHGPTASREFPALEPLNRTGQQAQVEAWLPVDQILGYQWTRYSFVNIKSQYKC